jgi:hypothetical protein
MPASVELELVAAGLAEAAAEVAGSAEVRALAATVHAANNRIKSVFFMQ